MYKKEFDKLETLPNFILFFGNPFYLQMYENKILDRFRDDNILKLYYDEWNFEKAKEFLSQQSLFGDKNVLIVKHNKKPQNIEKLVEFNKNNYLLFFYYGDKKISGFKNFVRFFAPSLKEKIEYINSIANQYGINLTQEAKLFLAKSIEESFFDKEIEKLSLYKKDLSLEDVKKLVFLYKNEGFEDVIVSILKGEDFYDRLNNLLEIVDYKRFLPAIISYVRELFEYNLYIKNTGSSSLKGFLGYQLPFDIEKERVNLAIKFKEKEYFELLHNLLQFELKMRNSNKNREAIFFEAVSFLKLFSTSY